jgi:hypothetical protein
VGCVEDLDGCEMEFGGRDGRNEEFLIQEGVRCQKKDEVSRKKCLHFSLLKAGNGAENPKCR